MEYLVGVDGKTFGERLEDLIKEKGETLKDVSEETGYAASSLSAYTSGKKTGMPRGDTIRKLAEYFDVTCDYLIGKVSASKSENYNASVEFGFNDNTAAALREMNYSGNDLKKYMCHGMKKIFNMLFENDFYDLLFKANLIVWQMTNLGLRDTEASEKELIENSSLADLFIDIDKPGIATVSSKEYFDFKISQLEREFGDKLRGIIDGMVIEAMER